MKLLGIDSKLVFNPCDLFLELERLLAEFRHLLQRGFRRLWLFKPVLIIHAPAPFESD